MIYHKTLENNTLLTCIGKHTSKGWTIKPQLILSNLEGKIIACGILKNKKLSYLFGKRIAESIEIDSLFWKNNKETIIFESIFNQFIKTVCQ